MHYVTKASDAGLIYCVSMTKFANLHVRVLSVIESLRLYNVLNCAPDEE